MARYDPSNGADRHRLAIIDVEDPSRPSVLNEGVFEGGINIFSGFDGTLMYSTWSLHAQGADDYKAIVHDLTDPSHPVELGRGNVTLGLRVSGATQFLTDGSLVFAAPSEGVYVMPLHCFQGVCIGDVGPDDDPSVRSSGQFVRVSPNPLNPSTSVSFSSSRGGAASLYVYTLSGRRVTTLVDGRVDAGTHVVTWNGRDDAGSFVASGVYVFRLSIAGRNVSARGTLLE